MNARLGWKDPDDLEGRWRLSDVWPDNVYLHMVNAFASISDETARPYVLSIVTALASDEPPWQAGYRNTPFDLLRRENQIAKTVRLVKTT